MEFYFYHNTETCVGCCACQLACKDHNNLAPGEFYRRVRPGPRSRAKRRHAFIPRRATTVSSPCASPRALNGAFYKEADGTVRHDDGKCIGCGKCLWACPYGSISLSKERGVAQKCTGCYDRRQQGLDPACVAACINRSLQWGKTDGRCDETTLHSWLPAVLPEPGKTGPRTKINCAILPREEQDDDSL